MSKDSAEQAREESPLQDQTNTNLKVQFPRLSYRPNSRLKKPTTLSSNEGLSDGTGLSSGSGACGFSFNWGGCWVSGGIGADAVTSSSDGACELSGNGAALSTSACGRRKESAAVALAVETIWGSELQR